MKGPKRIWAAGGANWLSVELLTNPAMNTTEELGKEVFLIAGGGLRRMEGACEWTLQQVFPCSLRARDQVREGS